MNNSKFEKGVNKLVDVNARVRANENVVIVTDPTRQEMSQMVADAASERGASVGICVMQERQHDGQEPPEPIASAMREAQVIFTPVSVSITHTVAMKKALEAGARAIMMTAWTNDIFHSPALLETDFEARAKVCRRLGKSFSLGKNIRITSPRGTNLTFSIEGRSANVLTNIPDPGELAPVPDIEVNVVPIEGTAQGKLIADASVPYLGIGILEEPISCTIEDGYITYIKGGKQAKILERDLLSHGDRNCFNIAELGVGLNPNARLTGVMLDDEGVLGTIHIGIGTNYTLGGDIVAPTHYDLLMLQPTIEVDGSVVQNDKEILV